MRRKKRNALRGSSFDSGFQGRGVNNAPPPVDPALEGSPIAAANRPMARTIKQGMANRQARLNAKSNFQPEETVTTAIQPVAQPQAIDPEQEQTTTSAIKPEAVANTPGVPTGVVATDSRYPVEPPLARSSVTTSAIQPIAKANKPNYSYSLNVPIEANTPLGQEQRDVQLSNRPTTPKPAFDAEINPTRTLNPSTPANPPNTQNPNTPATPTGENGLRQMPLGRAIKQRFEDAAKVTDTSDPRTKKTAIPPDDVNLTTLTPEQAIKMESELGQRNLSRIQSPVAQTPVLPSGQALDEQTVAKDLNGEVLRSFGAGYNVQPQGVSAENPYGVRPEVPVPGDGWVEGQEKNSREIIRNLIDRRGRRGGAKRYSESVGSPNGYTENSGGYRTQTATAQPETATAQPEAVTAQPEAVTAQPQSASPVVQAQGKNPWFNPPVTGKAPERVRYLDTPVNFGQGRGVRNMGGGSASGYSSRMDQVLANNERKYAARHAREQDSALRRTMRNTGGGRPGMANRKALADNINNQRSTAATRYSADQSANASRYTADAGMRNQDVRAQVSMRNTDINSADYQTRTDAQNRLAQQGISADQYERRQTSVDESWDRFTETAIRNDDGLLKSYANNGALQERYRTYTGDLSLIANPTVRRKMMREAQRVVPYLDALGDALETPFDTMGDLVNERVRVNTEGLPEVIRTRLGTDDAWIGDVLKSITGPGNVGLWDAIWNNMIFVSPDGKDRFGWEEFRKDNNLPVLKAGEKAKFLKDMESAMEEGEIVTQRT